RRCRGPENDENEGAGRVTDRTGQVRAGEGPRRTLRDQEGGGRLTPAIRRYTAGPVGATGDRGGGRRRGDRGQARRRARLVVLRPLRGPHRRGPRRSIRTQVRPAGDRQGGGPVPPTRAGRRYRPRGAGPARLGGRRLRRGSGGELAGRVPRARIADRAGAFLGSRGHSP